MPPFTPEARTSCARCHKRKKRCDRGLPACKNCQHARVRCSFLDNESHSTASYPISYVRALESRLQALEKRATSPEQQQQQQQTQQQPDEGDTMDTTAVSEQPEGDCSMFLETPDDTLPSMHPPPMPMPTPTPTQTARSFAPSTSPSQPTSPQTFRRHVPSNSNLYATHPPPQPSPYRSPTQMGSQLPPPPPPLPLPLPPPPPPPPSQPPIQTPIHPPPATSPSFAQELKSLSLEAAAERHVGSSSGVSFAKLTQMILCRLTPDKADFVFSEAGGSGGGDTSVVGSNTNTTSNGNADPQLVNFDSPSDLFNASVLHSLGESISVYPLLFGDVFLTDIMEPTAALDALTWPPTTVAAASESGAMTGSGSSSSVVGNEEHVNVLVDFYFSHSNTLYPIIVRREFLATLQLMREDPAAAAATLSALAQFRLWMVLAIGATAFSSVSLTEESEPMLYYNKALQFSEAALALDEMAALEVLTLQVSYSFFSQLGPNTWFLVGMAARVALGLGLHTAATYDKLAVDVAERRKRLFFSIYMMDRVVSMALGRPFALHDDDIDVEPFAAVDDECITPEGIRTTAAHALQPSILCVPRHILSLRQIASRIARQIYSSSAAAARRRCGTQTAQAEREAVLARLHQELIDWRRNMPFPLPDVDSRVPHLSSTWYDFNYYTHLASLYRPSPLFPVMDEKRVKILETAAAMAVRHAYHLHQQRRFAYNWLNFLSLFTATLSLIYATTAQPVSLARVLRETRAIEDLELAIELFATLSVKFSAAHKIRGMIAEICRRYRDVREGGEG